MAVSFLLRLASGRGGLWGRQTFRNVPTPVLAPNYGVGGQGGRASIAGWKIAKLGIDLSANTVTLVELFPLGSLLSGSLRVNYHQSSIAGVTAHRMLLYDGSTLREVDILSVGAGQVLMRAQPNGIVIDGSNIAAAISNLDASNAYNDGYIEAIFDGLHHFVTT